MSDLPPQLGGGATDAEIQAAIDSEEVLLVRAGVGLVMRRLRGAADPGRVAWLVRERLRRPAEPPEEDAG